MIDLSNIIKDSSLLEMGPLKPCYSSATRYTEQMKMSTTAAPSAYWTRVNFFVTFSSRKRTSLAFSLILRWRNMNSDHNPMKMSSETT